MRIKLSWRSAHLTTNRCYGTSRATRNTGERKLTGQQTRGRPAANNNTKRTTETNNYKISRPETAFPNKIFPGVLWRVGVKVQWGNQNVNFQGFWTLRLQHLIKLGQHCYII